jgi:LysR family transcriptional regulator of gallate degradation
MEFDLKQLRNLLAIARQGSFSRAAAALNMSQPALSNSIVQLERRLHDRVLDRGRHGAQLTGLGQLLVRHAELIEVGLERALKEIRTHERAAVGPLLIGVTPIAAAQLVPRALRRLRQETPNLSASVLEMAFADAMPALLKGQIDLMVGPVGVYAKVDGVEEERLTTDPFAVIVRSGHPLCRRRSISLRELADAAWVLPNDQSAFHHQLEALFIVAGVAWPTNAIVTNSMVALKSMVVHGDGVTIIPRQLVALEREAGLLHCIDLIEAGAARALGLSWARDRKLSPLAQRFAEIIRACASEERVRPLGQVRRRTREYAQVAKSHSHRIRKKSIS